MSSLKNILKMVGGGILAGGVGESATPKAPAAVNPPSIADASKVSEDARRTVSGRGRAASILTGELGVNSSNTDKRRTLGVSE